MILPWTYREASSNTHGNGPGIPVHIDFRAGTYNYTLNKLSVQPLAVLSSLVQAAFKINCDRLKFLYQCTGITMLTRHDIVQICIWSKVKVFSVHTGMTQLRLYMVGTIIFAELDSFW